MKHGHTVVASVATVAALVILAGCGSTATIAHPAPPHYIYVVGQHVTAINDANGQSAWATTASATSMASVATTPTTFYVGELGGIAAVDRGTGTQRWTANTGAALQVFADGKHVYVIGTGLITALDAQSGQLVWHQTAQTGSSAALAADGATLYTASGQALQAWNTATGATRWDHESQTASDPYCVTMTLISDLVVCNSYGGHVAWHAADGSQAWQLADPQFQDIGISGMMLYGVSMPQIVTTGSALYALNLTTGTLHWHHAYTDGTDAIIQPAVLSPDGQRIFVGQGPQGGDIASIDTTTGTQQWTKASLGMVGKFAVTNTHLYVLYTDSLHSFDPATGSEQWTKPIPNAFQATMYPEANGILLANSGQLTAYDSAGKVRWQQFLDSNTTVEFMS